MTEATPDRDRLAPLSVETDLTLTVDGADAEVRSTGERLFVEFESLLGAVRAARALRGVPGGASEGSRRLAAVLGAGDLTVEVRVRHRTVAVVGSGARPGVLSRGLGVDPVESRIGGLLGAVGQELSAGVRAVSRVFE